MSRLSWSAKWAKPSPVYADGALYYGDGILWYGLKGGPTEEDYATLKRDMKAQGQPYTVDPRTLVGRHDASWTTAGYEKVDMPAKYRVGGLGSRTYEFQNITPGANIATKKIWIHGEDGTLEKIVPPNSGLYWIDDEQLPRAGARPGSAADIYIGDGEIYFDGLWKVRE